MNNKNEITAYLENISLLLLIVFFAVFPFAILTVTTDLFSLPKQILLAIVVSVTLLLFGAKAVNEGSVRIRKTPFDLAVFLLGLFAFLSALFAINRYDSLIAYVPFLLAIILYFILVNQIKTWQYLFILMSALVIGAAALSLNAILSFSKIYLLPFTFTHVRNFTPVGSLLDQCMYLLLTLPIACYFGNLVFTIKDITKLTLKNILFALASLVILAGILVSGYQLFTSQKPLILPLETGFQTAFAAISQDQGRTFQGFLAGSGFGTYVTNFTRFKQAAFNTNKDLWSVTFFNSSNFILEILATTGVLGFGALIYLLIKTVNQLRSAANRKAKNPFSFSLFLLLFAVFLVPFSFIIYTLFFIILALFSIYEGSLTQSGTHHGYFDVELYFAAFRKSVFPLTSVPVENSNDITRLIRDQSDQEKSLTRFLPITLLVLVILFVGFVGYNCFRFVLSDTLFQSSLVAASQNNGSLAYQLQNDAISQFSYRDGYHRIFSQLNLQLANNLASSQPKNASPSAQVQQTIYTLIQQSINSARNATTISPYTTFNWQNLSSVYRNIIGFGQNAEQFAVVSAQQATTLDPNNPQEYITLGGLFYQLSQWDNAIRQFQIAVTLKPDLANAYYNLGHALENKGDAQSLQAALQQYQTVKGLTPGDATSQKKIATEIQALQKKIGSQNATSSASARPVVSQTANQQPPLEISSSSAQLPQQANPVKIPGPNTSSPSAK